MTGMGVTGGRKVRSTVGSMPNRGCIFGSMGGLPPTIGVLAINGAIYRNQTSYCNDQCIPVGCKEGFEYLKKNGLITYNKSSGGIGRIQTTWYGRKRAYGNGYQRYV